MEEKAEHPNKGRVPHNKGKKEFPHRKQIRLDQKSFDILKKLETEYNMNSSEIIRKLIREMNVRIHVYPTLSDESKHNLSILSHYSNNLNQLTKRANELAAIYSADEGFIRRVTHFYADLENFMSDILSKLIMTKTQ